MKKFAAMFMVIVMCLSVMTGCGSKSDTPAAGNDAAQDSTQAVFMLGGCGPITGDAAIYGTAVMNGIQIAVDEVNAAGGINGYQVQFRFEDDANDGETAVNAYNTLMDWGMQAMIGPVTTAAGITVSAKAYDERVFVLTPSASSPDVTKDKDNVFQLCFSDPNQGVGSAEYMGEHMQDAKIAIIYRNDDAYSQGIRDNFIEKSAGYGLSVVYEGTFTKDTATDFSVQLTAAQSAGADTVFLPIYYQPASVILAQANAMGYAPTFFGVDGMDGILTLENFDTSLAEDVMLLTPFFANSDNEVTKNFVAEYERRHGETPNQFAADGYDSVYAMKKAMETAGCTPDMSTAELCEALVGVFTTISLDGTTGTSMTWGANGEVSKPPVVVVIKDGVYEEVK